MPLFSQMVSSPRALNAALCAFQFMVQCVPRPHLVSLISRCPPQLRPGFVQQRPPNLRPEQSTYPPKQAAALRVAMAAVCCQKTTEVQVT